jgi:hypothetical protein
VAACVGRFFGEGLVWALNLPIPALHRWWGLIPEIVRRERG